MFAALKSEFRKLLTIRSTYVILLLLTIFIAIGALYIEGFTNNGAALDNHKFASVVLGGSASIIGQFVMIIAILLMAHEYRYNTINYTLSLTNKRSKVLGAKVISTAVLAVVVAVVGALLTLGLTYVGLKLKGVAIPHQDLMLGSILLKTATYTLGLTLLGLMVITLLRNLTAAIIIMFAGPGILNILELVLKKNADYLPFNALAQVITAPLPSNLHRSVDPTHGTFSPVKGAVVFGIYLAVGWAITWWLFLRRDAS